MRSSLLRETLTLHRRLGEDSEGVEQYADIHITGCYFEGSAAQVRATEGVRSDRRGLAVLPPEGYGSAWNLEPEDFVTARGQRMMVLEVEAVYSALAGSLSHVEVSLR